MSTIYKFSSTAPNGLFAFAGDRAGSQLPENHGPWKPDGALEAREPIPYRLDRAAIEQAISEHGYQMWRMKKDDAEEPVIKRRAGHGR